MRHLLLYLLLPVMLLFGSRTASQAQTTLAAGDIAFIGLYTSGSGGVGDAFTFVTLKALSAGTVIYFTDDGWNNGAWGGSASEVHFTWSPPAGGSPIGTIVTITGGATNTVPGTPSVGTCSATFLSGTTWHYPTGEEILAYQSSSGARPASPTFIAGMMAYYNSGIYNSTTKWCSTTAGFTEMASTLPEGLTNGTNCVSVLNATNYTGVSIRNCRYNGSLTGTASAVRALINSDANWTRVTTTPFDITSAAFPTPSITGSVAPTVTTQAVSSIAVTTATGNGNITSLGSPNPTAYGVCWNTGGTPTTSDSKNDKGAASSTGAFTASMTGLTAGTPYYVRAFATNTAGTSYGTEVSFTTTCSNAITVTNNTNSGAGSFRQAITDVCDGGTITFNLATGNETITIASEIAITKAVTIDGANTAGSGTLVTVQVTTPGTSNWRIFNINASGKTIAIQNMTIRGGNISVGDGMGGGIYLVAGTLNLTDSNVSGSKAYNGGGIAVQNSATLNVTNSTISGCYATGGDLNGSGGGIWVNTTGAFNLTNSTISGCFADYVGGGIINGGTAIIKNSTIANNTSDNALQWTAGEYMGGGIVNVGSAMTLSNSIIANNISKIDVGGTQRDDSRLDGGLTDSGYNVSGITTDGNNNVSPLTGTGDWNLSGTSGDTYTKVGGGTGSPGTLNLSATLALNSSTNGTYTLALTSGSFAIDIIPSASSYNSSPATDQRGVTRTGATTSIGAYSNIPVAVPTITGISPTSGPTAGGTTVVITGTNLTGATAVSFGATSATGYTVNSDTQITATSPAGSAGTVDVTVTTTGGTSATSSSDQFTYIAPPSATTNAATSVTSTGATLNGTINANGSSTTVTFEYGLTTGYGTSVTAVESPVTGSSATSVSKAITGLSSSTNYHFRVKGVNGGGTTSGLDQSFNTSVGTPTISSFTPTTVCSEVSTVTITGTNFTGATLVSFGGTAATSFNVVSNTSITAVVGSGTTGTVSVTTPSGTATSSGTLTFNISPTLTLGTNPTINAGATSASLTFSGITPGAVTPTNSNFSYTGGAQTLTVPAGVTSISIDAGGAQGGGDGTNTLHSKGGRVQATLAVTAGQVLNIYVGGAGGNGSLSTASAAVGGFNGGGTAGHYNTVPPGYSGGGGGGASDIRIGGTALSNRVLVAGGGGGSGYTSSPQIGGAGGGTTGGAGATGSGIVAATGGTPSAGGSGGTFSGKPNGSNGALGIGGNASSGNGIPGGGGGGYYGGGGGGTTGSGPGGGGGGGSSYTDPTLTSVTHTQGYNSGSAYVNLSYDVISGQVYTYSIVWGADAHTASFVDVTNATLPTSPISLNIPAGAASNTYTGTLTVNDGTCSSTNYSFSVTVGIPPTATTSAASSVTSTGATLNGSINANSASTAVTFEYGTTVSYGTSITADQSPVTGSSATSVSKAITGLTPNTTYHYRVVGVSANGTTNGSDQSFTTLYAAPTTQASAIVFSSVQTTQMTIGWTSGNGANRAVFVKAANTGTATPVDNTTYTANTTFTSGTQIGSTGWYCVYNGTGTSVTVTGLTTATDYIAQVFEYNGSAGAEKYYTATATNNPKSQTTQNSVSSINRSDSDPTNATSVSWTVTFAASLTGLNTSKFSLTGTGLTGYSVSGITGSGATYTVTASTGSGSGTLRLNLSDATGLSQGISNTLPYSGQTYTIDKTAPSAPTISGISAGYFNTNQTFTVSGEAGATIEYSTNNGGLWTAYSGAVTLSAEGTYNVLARQTDQAGNGPTASAVITLTIDKTAPSAPTISGISAGYYNTNQTFTVNGEAGATIEYSTNNGGLWTAYSGAVTLSAEGTYNVLARQTDQAGNGPTASAVITLTIDKTAPTISSVGVPSNSTYVSTQNLDFTVNFSEAVNVVTTGGTPYLTVTIGSTGVHAAYLSGSGTAAIVFRYSVVYGDLDTNGIDLGSNITANGGTLRDGAGNNATLTFTGSNLSGVLVDFATPTTQASSLVFSSVGLTQMTIDWTSGNSANRAVFVKEGAGAITNPSNNTTYTASTNWASKGAQLGSSGYYCIYNGTGTSVPLTGLTAGTQYTAQVFEYNGGEAAEKYYTSTATNNPKSQSTNSLPTVTTQAASNIWSGSATGNGNITGLGFPYPTAYGICWGTSANPTVADNKTNSGSTSTVGAFTGSITSLTPGTTYYVRAYATNAEGTSYGEELNFTASSNLLDNPGAELDYTAWTKTDGGSGWSTTSPDLSPYSGSKLWVSSYNICTLTQTVDLISKGFSASALDMSIPISASAYVANNIYSYGIATIMVELLNESNGVMNTYYVCNETYIPIGYLWTKKEILISGYSTGLRKIRFSMSGIDMYRRWGGQYGPAFDDTNISFNASACANPTSGGTIGTDQTGCTPFDPAAFTSSALPTGHTGTLEYKWQLSTTSSSSGFSDIASTNSATFDPGSLTANTWYRRLSRVTCKDNWTGAATSNVVQITVDPASVGGVVSGTASITYGSTTGTLTLGGQTGSVVRWQKKIGSGAWTDVSNTAATYSETPSSAGSWQYRAQVKNGSCTDAFSDPVTITVSPKALTITADDKSKTYDGAFFSPFTVSYSGFITGEDASFLGGTLAYSGTATTAVNAGIDYVITPGGLTSGNYDITFVNGELDITKKALSVTADDKTKVYDGAVYSPFTVTYSGFISGESATNLGGTLAYSGTATTAVNAGTNYVITPGGLTSGNYDITFVNGKLDITKKALSVTADDKTKVYDGSVYSPFTVTYSGFITGESAANLGGTLAYSGTATTAVNAGTNYVITPGGLTSGNYDITFVNGKLDITKKALSVTADDKTKVYDGSVYSPFTVTYSGFITGESAANLGGTLAYSGTATTAVNAGTNYVITPGGLTSGNYDITFVNGKLDITKKALSVTADDKTKVYDGSVYSPFTVTYSGFITGESAANLGGTLAYSGTATTAVNAGTNYVITPGGLTSGNYDITFVNGKLDITKKALSVTADDKTKVYDGSVYSPFTVTYSGFITGESAANLGGTLTYSGTATTAVNVGTNYVITPGGLTSGNYDITFVNGKLDITKKALSVTADDKTKVYDGAVYSPFTVTYSGFISGESATNLGGTLTYSGTATTAVNVGTNYVITPGGLTSGNYNITFVAGVLDITKKALSVTADDKTKVYDGAVFSPFTVTYSGFISGESAANLGGTLTYSGTATTAVNAGTNYVITPGGLTSGNYDITFVNGKLDITKKALTIMADDKSKVHDGAEYSPFTVSYSGFVAGESAANLGGSLSFSGTATTAVNAGTNYIITPGGLTSGNYNITFVAGVLDITKKTLSVTANDKSKVYDGVVFGPFTVTYSGFVAGESAANLGGSLAFSGTATTAVNAGTNYIITPGGLTSGNYDITFVAGKLDITKKALSVTADNKSKVYDGAVFNPFTVTYSGFVAGESAANLGGSLSFSGTATSAVNVGTNYVINPGGLTSGNYDITFVSGKLDITKKSLSITADDKSKVYDGTVFNPFTVTYSGLATGETSSVLGGSLVFGGTATTAFHVGTNYVIAPSGLTSGNYNITFVAGKLDITKKVLTITADDKRKCYDGAVFSGNYTISVSGFALGDGLSSLGGNLTFNGIALGAIGAGSYTFIPGGLTSGNYNIQFKNGTLIIDSMPVPTITGQNVVCAGSSKFTYTTESGMNNYTWSSSGKVIQGASTNTIDVEWNTAGPNIVVVNYSNSNGCLAMSSTVKNVTVNPIITNSGNIAGKAALCAGEQGVAYSTPIIPNADTYVWTLPPGASIVEGNNTPNIHVDFASNAFSGAITVKGKNSCMEGPISQPFQVTVNAVPQTPVITNEGDILKSNIQMGNQWYFQDILIPGAVNMTYEATTEGKYWAMVVLQGCNSGISNIIDLTTTGDSHLGIYPVPNPGQFTATLNYTTPETLTLSVYTKVGKKIYEKDNISVFGKYDLAIDLGDIPSGIYIVEIKSTTKTITHPIMINK